MKFVLKTSLSLLFVSLMLAEVLAYSNGETSLWVSIILISLLFILMICVQEIFNIFEWQETIDELEFEDFEEEK